MMISKKNIFDLLWTTTPQVMGFVAGFISSILLARGLGVSSLGYFALLSGFYGLVSGISDLGVGQVAIRFSSLYKSEGRVELQYKVLRWAFRARLSLALLFSVIAALMIPVLFDHVWSAPDLKKLALISLLIGLFQAFSTIPNVYFQSEQKFKVNALITSGQSVINLCGVAFLAIFSYWSLQNVILISVCSTFVGACIFLFIIPNKTLWNGWEEYSNFKDCLLPPEGPVVEEGKQKSSQFALHLLIASIVVTLTTRADIMLMGAFLGPDQMGLYNVATRFTLPLMFGLGALNTALWPKASAITDKADLKLMFGKLWRLTGLVCIVGLLYSIFAPIAAPYIFGDEYVPAVLMAQFLCIRYCFAIMTCPIGIVGYSLGLSNFYWKVNIVQFVVVLIVNIVLLPRIGVMASVIGLMLNELISGGLIFARVISSMKKD